ncbi:hypothetical protein SAMN05428642_10653 [Flaviramulus basaltis]|uniref:Uncharacterized protein n=1 Tax=Flaviramulus basaltis TaxID=369401 RepID=A0A1K2IRW6_9FLAO|nr:hypothetical protein SAMN05428642_10653 [Flaviramulus basaltis]
MFNQIIYELDKLHSFKNLLETTKLTFNDLF